MKNSLATISSVAVLTAAISAAALVWAQEHGAPAPMGPSPSGSGAALQNNTSTKATQTDSSAKEKLTDSSFVEKAAQNSLAEVQAAKLAIDKSQNKKIKQFAQRSLKEHTAASDNLKQVASANRLELPAGVTAEQKKMLDQLQQLSGSEFDTTYASMMKKNYDTTVGLFDNAAGEPSLNAELRVFANKALPTLRKQQKQAHGLIDTDTQIKSSAR